MITFFLYLGDVKKFCDPFIVNQHTKNTVVTLLILEGGDYIALTIQYGYLIFDIIEVPVHKCGMIGSANFKV